MPRPALLSLLALMTAASAAPAQDDLHDRAAAALKRAATFYHDKVASHGGYVYYYAEDLSQRWGEGKGSPDLLFVERPGTPAVGLAYLRAYAATNDPLYLAAARDAANCLLYGQLESGGWTQTISFDAADKRVGKYRNGKGGKWNRSSLDDGVTQNALRFLIRADEAHQFKDPAIHDAARYALDALIKAQFKNGAFPQSWDAPAADQPVLAASYPDYDWRTEHRAKNYWDYYTLNDNLAGTVADALLTAHAVYKHDRYLAALRKLGDFLLLAQMPEPQPAWCQQYDYAMHPIWARKFEPPAVTGWESQDAIETLIKVSLATGDQKYLAPIPRATAYLRTCVLPDGRIPRYLELKTNKPLYMDAAYRLTYDDADAPAHYGWKQGVRLDAIEAAYRAAVDGKATPARPSPRQVEVIARRALETLDADGRWVSTYAGERLTGQPKFAAGFRYISSAVFIENVEALSAAIESAK